MTSPQAFSTLRERGLKVRRPDLTIATMDHSTPTTSRDLPMLDPVGKAQLDQMRKNCKDFGIRLYDLKTTKQGIVHVIGPEQGLTQPGMTIVCGDSHTATHGHSVHWRSASEPARWGTCSPRSACCRLLRRPTRFAWMARSGRACPPRTLFWR